MPRGKRGENAPIVLQLDADYLRNLGTQTRCLPLSERTVSMLLSLLEYQKMGRVHGSRWKGDYTWDEVQTWVDAATKELMDESGCVVFTPIFRLNELCVMQVSYDNGETWE